MSSASNLDQREISTDPRQHGTSDESAGASHGDRVRRRFPVGAAIIVGLAVATFLGLPLYRYFTAVPDDGLVQSATPVAVALPTVGPAERVVRFSGTLTPEATTTIVPKVGGRVMEVAVRENQRVVAGDLIARIEDDALRLQVATARAAYDAANAQYRQAVRGARQVELEIAQASVDQAVSSLEAARVNFDRTERLFQAGTVSRSAFEDARDRFQSADTEVQNARRSLSLMQEGAGAEERDIVQANVDAAARQLELAELQLDFAALRAPIDGIVARVMVEPGQTVGASSGVATLVNDRLIYARVAVSERLYGRFRGREGTMEVRISPLAYEDDPPFIGRVSSVSSVIDSASRTFVVEVAMDNADGRLRPGMFVRAEFVVESTADALLVPNTALHIRDGRTVVFVLDGDLVAVRPVVADALPGAFTQIRSGLRADEVVVVEGAAFLQDGAPVAVSGHR
ncbi:MAG: efflux RND transporter periplasmic adaptor subunit [Spirochaetaceae bacterium]|nr:MAG: efflux RND transporter periplasmic adaptor subunit [Spirochaetaceae bacterium]